MRVLYAEEIPRDAGRVRECFKEPALRLVLMLFGKGTRMPEHQAAGPLTLHVLSGSVALRLGGRTVEIGTGALVAPESAIEHEMEALEESACLLTLAGAC